MPKSSFVTYLETAEGGELNEDLSKALTEISKVLRERAAGTKMKKATGGKINLSLSFSFEDGMMAVVSNIAHSVPPLPRRKGLFFVAGDGALTKTDPMQMDMLADEPPRITAEVREIKDDGPQIRTIDVAAETVAIRTAE